MEENYIFDCYMLQKVSERWACCVSAPTDVIQNPKPAIWVNINLPVHVNQIV